MASLMENLIEVLDKESREYESLLGLSMKKTPVIVSGNLEELAKITEEEQIVVSKGTGNQDARLYLCLFINLYRQLITAEL